MTLESKYNVGDTPYYLSNGVITQLYIVSVTIKKVFERGNINNRIVKLVDYQAVHHLNKTKKFGHIHLEALFDTKEEAARKMLKNAGMDCGMIEIKG